MTAARRLAADVMLSAGADVCSVSILRRRGVPRRFG